MKKVLFMLLVMRSFHGESQNIPAFKQLRYEEDYSMLKNDSSKNWYEDLKFTSLVKNGNTYISFGGDVRYQYFRFKNEGWGEAKDNKDGFMLTRYLEHVDFHAGEHFRTYVELQSSLANGEAAPPSPVDENPLDLHQAFFDVLLPLQGQQDLTIRVGRQELLYGSQRLVSVRDGPNNRQSFDAAKLIYARRRLKLDAFFSYYVVSQTGIFDDALNKNNKFWGAYAVINRVPVLQNVDVYYFGLQKAKAIFDDGSAREERHSAGARIWKSQGSWQYDFEGVWQWGQFGANNILAWTVSSNTSYTFKRVKGKPQVGLKTELISGDKKYNDGHLNTFNPLYPRGAYFGQAALIGPANLADIHPYIELELMNRLSWQTNYDLFWRMSSNDGIYGPNVKLIYTGKNTSSKEIGKQLETELIYAPNNYLYFRFELTWFAAGDYLKQVGPGKDILLTGLTAQLRF